MCLLQPSLGDQSLLCGWTLAGPYLLSIICKTQLHVSSGDKANVYGGGPTNTLLFITALMMSTGKKNDTEAVNIENCSPFAEYFDKYEDDLQAAIVVSVSLD